MQQQPFKSGKVRDIYEAGEHLIIVASDRISAFDCILPTPITGKGKVLSSISKFWFSQTSNIIPNHFISDDLADFPIEYREQKDWAGRAMLVKRAEVLPIECVVRGYLAGGGWKEYQHNGTVSGVALPAALRESQQLPEPIFTPSTKAESGHDEPISFEQTAELIGEELAQQVKSTSLQLYSFAADYARQRGIIIADTKFEFGLIDGKLALVDEALTPDSSRFWDVGKYTPGVSQDSFDKQFVRDYLETLDWDKTPPAPALPPEIMQRTLDKYLEAYSRLTGSKLDLTQKYF
jgi:phosphoribosylaminoimidazole-succinocarboxamide synthase